MGTKYNKVYCKTRKMQLKLSLNQIRKLIDDIRKSAMYTQLNCPK